MGVGVVGGWVRGLANDSYEAYTYYMHALVGQVKQVKVLGMAACMHEKFGDTLHGAVKPASVSRCQPCKGLPCLLCKT